MHTVSKQYDNCSTPFVRSGTLAKYGVPRTKSNVEGIRRPIKSEERRPQKARAKVVGMVVYRSLGFKKIEIYTYYVEDVSRKED